MLIGKENQRRSRKTQEHVYFLKTFNYSTITENKLWFEENSEHVYLLKQHIITLQSQRNTT